MLGDHPTLYLVVFTEGQQKSLDFPGFLELFWATRHSCPGDHAAKAKTSSLAAFAVTILLLRPGIPSPKEFHIPLLPSALAHHVETMSHPTKHTLLHVTSPRVRLNMLRWMRWESNPRPQRLHLEGVTTIQLLYCQNIYMSNEPTHHHI